MIAPLQSQADAFYGNPRGKNGLANPNWENANLVRVYPPFKMYYAGKPIQSVTIHKKCQDTLLAALNAIWVSSGKSQAVIDKWGVSVFGGSYNFRLKRGSNTLSMHAYACAIDLDPANHPMKVGSKPFVPEVINAFKAQGWYNLPNDKMHFQFARIG